MAQPLMPMATAVWLVDNTALSFRQIADFCEIHELEIQGIADGTVGMHMVGQDPIANGQLTQEEIDRCQADRAAVLQMVEGAEEIKARAKGPRYTRFPSVKTSRTRSRGWYATTPSWLTRKSADWWVRPSQQFRRSVTRATGTAPTSRRRTLLASASASRSSSTKPSRSLTSASCAPRRKPPRLLA